MVYDFSKNQKNTKLTIPYPDEVKDTTTDKDKPNTTQNNKEIEVSQTDREIFELPSGSLGSTKLKLSCKGPMEKKFYSFSVKNRMLVDDKIASVKVSPTGDRNVTADKYSFQEQSFTVRLSGGKLNSNVPLRCEVTTEKEETLDFVCILPVREEGILYENQDDGIVVIMGSTGPQGNGIYSVSIDKDFSLVITMSDGTVQKIDIGIVKDKNGQLMAIENSSFLPDDFSINGSLYIASSDYVNGNKTMPNGLSLNGNIVLTDGSVFYKNTWNNGGVLCAA